MLQSPNEISYTTFRKIHKSFFFMKKVREKRVPSLFSSLAEGQGMEGV